MTIAEDRNRRKAMRSSHDAPPLSMSDFFRLRKLIKEVAGISLGENKVELLRGRLHKRLTHHGLSSFRDYIRLLRDETSSGQEMVHFINRVTTNKTHFFRESYHFDFLRDTVLPRVPQQAIGHGRRKLRLWSAACSTGEETYSIAMTISEFFNHSLSWDIKILGSDIDSNCLKIASSGTYPIESVADLSIEQKRNAFQRGTGNSEGYVRIRPALRDMIKFKRINFVDPAWPIQCKFDAIFCRNALIYFERDFQQALVRRLLGYLQPNGYLFLGHSENLSWMPELQPIGNTIYVPSTSECR